MKPTGCNVISKEELDQFLQWIDHSGIGQVVVEALMAIPVIKRKRKRKVKYYLHMPCTCKKITVIVGLDKDGNGEATCGYCGKQYKVGITITIEVIDASK